jgi:hypothetical protein
MHPQVHRLTLLLITTLPVLFGCGGKDDAPPATPVDAAGPVYLLGGTVFGTPRVSYLVPIASLAAGTTVDYARGLEMTGGAGFYGVPGSGQVFVGSGESPELTRYLLDAGGTFVRGPTLSLAGQGFSTALVNDGGVVFLSETKAYFIHQEDLRAVIWNPSTMELVAPLPLPEELRRDGFQVVFDGKAQRRDDDLYLIASWADHTNGRYPAGTLLITIDTRTDAVVSRELDPRCGQVFGSVRHPSGDIYYACSTWAAATHRVLGQQYGSESCLLRVRKGERRFDPTFYVKLPDLVGGRVAGDLAGTAGTEGFMRVLDETTFPIPAQATVSEVTGAAAWRWWRLDLDRLEARPLDLAPSAAGATELAIDGATFTSVSAADFSQTTLIEMTAPGGPRPSLTLRGFVHSGLRLR